jgi:glycosidase
MKFDLDQSTIQIKQGNLISLPDAEGSTIAVLWGKVWLTQDGHQRDYDLSSGESFTIRGDGLILISALENSALTILQPCEHFATPSAMVSENAEHAAMNGKTNERRGVHYVSAEELQQFKRNAHELRARYIASLFVSLGDAISHGLTKMGDFAVAFWLNHARMKWIDPRHRLYLS